MEEAEQYFLIWDEENLQITTNVQLYMIENNLRVCEVMRFDSVDDALDALIETREKIDEEIKKQMN